jgi:broad specificity phosphatase PhoE
MSGSHKNQAMTAEECYRKWCEAKNEMVRLRNYYEVDFQTAFQKITDLKDVANHYWDQYETRRSAEGRPWRDEGRTLYDIWTQLNELITRLERQAQSQPLAIKGESEALIQSLQERASDLWFDLERFF